MKKVKLKMEQKFRKAVPLDPKKFLQDQERTRVTIDGIFTIEEANVLALLIKTWAKVKKSKEKKCTK